MTFGNYARAATTLALAGIVATGAMAAESGSAPKKDKSKPIPPPAFKNLAVLFSGKESDLEQNWVQLGSNEKPRWKLEGDAMVSVGGDIITKQKYSDFQLHLEFRVPYMPEAHGQERGNSGVFLQGRYEIQVLDSYGKDDPGTGDCGAIYSQSAPLTNAYKPPLQWQTYDMTFRGARNGANGEVIPARVTILLNGIVVQNNQPMKGVTGAAIDDRLTEPGPLRLQFHGNTVAYRNIWIVPLPPEGANHY